jgi:hypothetical protein
VVLFSLLIDAQGGFEAGDERLVAKLYAGKAFSKSLSKPPTAKGYKDACKKLPARIVEQLQKQIHEQEYTAAGETYHGLKVIIVDGTKVSVPATDETIEKYGMGYGHYAQCQAVGFFELSTGTFDHFDFAQTDTPERNLAYKHMVMNKVQTLYLGDAGYNGMAFIGATTETGHHILMPLKMGALKEQFRKTRKRSAICELKLTQNHLKNYPDHQHLVGVIIKIRLIRAYGTSRMKAPILITTLLDSREYPWQELAHLYRQRYTIELAFRHLKQKIKIEAVRKRVLNRIEQLLYASIALYNLSAVIRNRARKPSILPKNTGVRMICFSYCIDVADAFAMAAVHLQHGAKTELARQMKAIRHCTFVYVPWRAAPRICHTPPSKFTVQKGAENDAEIKKAEFLTMELPILRQKYEAIGA